MHVSFPGKDFAQNRYIGERDFLSLEDMCVVFWKQPRSTEILESQWHAWENSALFSAPCCNWGPVSTFCEWVREILCRQLWGGLLESCWNLCFSASFLSDPVLHTFFHGLSNPINSATCFFACSIYRSFPVAESYSYNIINLMFPAPAKPTRKCMMMMMMIHDSMMMIQVMVQKSC